MKSPPSVPESFLDGAKPIELAHAASVAPSKLIEAVSPMNDPLAGPRRRLLRGGGYLTPPQKSSLTKIRDKRAMEAGGPDGPVDSLRSLPRGKRDHSPLENLRFPTGPWTRFEEAHGGHAPTSFHSPLPPGRLKGEIDREDTQSLPLPSVAWTIVT